MIHFLDEEAIDEAIHSSILYLKVDLASETNIKGSFIMNSISTILRVGLKWHIEESLENC